ncbi:phosphatase PAP2 family protein [Agrobacterium vaccinii]|uniref:phosphatase PAP2 family protein n=1 Tax=Agrobacterium vaccinii TaxID=2735528 RepID=UPI001E3C1A7B|nr:phosphatase PAP2 family protein [Agrobacterium vaccinii]UHS61930.1 phosphatase PAP2 family protein [Agrobacterium vaccinii]
MTDVDIAHMRITMWLTIATLFAVIVLAICPFIDLRVAELFFMGEAGRWWAGGPVFEFWRNVIRRGGEVIAVIAFLIFLGNLALGQQQKTGWRVWAYLWISTASCAGMLVNGILKSNLGRARPNGVIEFGGQQLFTPAFQLANQCSSNCSFSSGEVALVASLVLPFCVLIWPQLSRIGKVVCACLAIAAIVTTAMMRMAAGRHFLSDTVMSVLFAAMISVFLYRALAIGSHRHVFTVRPVLADISCIAVQSGRYAMAMLRMVMGSLHRSGTRLRILGAKEYERLFTQSRSRATAE